MSIDINAVEPISYEKSYVAFLDVLGFKNLVFSNSSESKNKINQYFGIVNSAIEYLSSIPSKRSIGSIIISDSVILSVPHGTNVEENIDTLRHLCIAVGIIQQHLALKDIWLRGAISSGDTFFDAIKGQIVGPAYINAYLLEEESAIFPRVILDGKIIKELNFSNASDFISRMNKDDEGGLRYSNWASPIIFNWNYPNGKTVEHIEQDLPLFIDYLSPIATSNNNLLTVIKNIENNIYQKPSIYIKFRWIANYLKATLEKWRLNHIDISSEALFKLNNL
ncbi:hypothetical protein [Aeromonas veronii]|uniref:hypothetical protein n=1 Tax=Aeromonas veronii TaxID=654 RepID=UPI001F25CDDD|nr:hypothetical protein [Aeromonas veronii]MCF5844419.1 hypothetical protein [Aeromonas veronii]